MRDEDPEELSEAAFCICLILASQTHSVFVDLARRYQRDVKEIMQQINGTWISEEHLSRSAHSVLASVYARFAHTVRIAEVTNDLLRETVYDAAMSMAITDRREHEHL